ncbi:MAG: hypothetical protein PHZ14_09015, partial [Sulfuricella sp.]|nr:hypothetical protein [Sulfuricella sp.]
IEPARWPQWLWLPAGMNCVPAATCEMEKPPLIGQGQLSKLVPGAGIGYREMARILADRA